MLKIIYLVYQEAYSFATDDLFHKWVRLLDLQQKINSIVIVDNFDADRKAESQMFKNIRLNIVPGDNAEREFSGYQKGLSLLQGEDGIVILLNDTFLTSKHHPWELLLPAVIQACRKIQNAPNDCVWGEVNRGPTAGKFDGVPATWISTYCMLFSSSHLNSVQAAIRRVLNKFQEGATKFNSVFSDHIDRQIIGLPASKSSGARLRKFQATAAEISLSRILQSYGLSIRSIYAFSADPLLFAKYTIMRIKRKIVFIRRY